MQSAPLLALLQNPLRPRIVVPNWVLSMGQIELNCIVLDGTVLTFKLCTYAKLNCLK